MRWLLSIPLTLLTLFPLVPSALGVVHHVSTTGDDAWPGSQAQPWATLQHAADVVGSGDVVIVQPGTYAGFRAQSSGAEGAAITFQGQSGAILNSASPEAWHGSVVEIEDEDWWIVEGFEITNSSLAGVDVRLADHVTVRDCLVHHNDRWGIFTAFTDDFTAEDNECSHSEDEHGIYVSNSADRATLRRNHCHHNNACGIQINADPSMGGDGVSSNCVISHNILHDNGAAGGAAINLASVRDSLVANNLIHANLAGGVAGWDDGQGDEWGTMNNQFYNNTVHMPAGSRRALSLINGSSGNQLRNNILLHEDSWKGGLELDSSSLTGLSSDRNVLALVELDDDPLSLSEWRTNSGQDANSLAATAAELFVSPGSDYGLSPGSPALDVGEVLAEVLDDLEGRSRPQGSGWDLGCLEREVELFDLLLLAPILARQRNTARRSPDGTSR